ncbi:phospholipid-binding protein MlaC [Thioalkalivibrio sp. XN279]|uniref:MlaC/ttg2D family ABC transporter substrate-binding protein n=1 Tax=Thioalkalivibrio sp. XN279 TaxID=2714953 RepID=UPI001407D096|nr:ABC transporter substrate-binding protein [Thioalkalivibrio sp. XN279]NHA14722.1 ABC transporter substrate-binding protein [Thioalkalivibrio sp. XN279]
MRITLSLVALMAIAAAPALAETQPGPEQVIREASELTIQAIDGRREELKQDRAALFAIVDEVLLPRWDRSATGQAVMGRYWREATPEQREAFINGLYRKLLDSYGEGILEYNSDQLKITGTRGDPDKGLAVVDSEVKLTDGTVVPISYRLRFHDGSWKVFDVIVEGISYLTTYRNQYASEFRAKGIQAVIDELQASLPDSSSGS